MKNFSILIILLLSSVLSFYSCNNKTKTKKEDNTKPVVKAADSLIQATSNAKALKEPAQNVSGVWHYTCRLGCPDGAGTATKCKTCGNTLAHNTVYHTNTNDSSSNMFNQPPTSPSTTKPNIEPAQNAAGVWHYTCLKGCVGGSGSAGACTSCNGSLAHNAAYH